MNEDYLAETMETADSTEGTPEVSLDDFDAGWDGDGYSESGESDEADMEDAGSETEEADQPTGDATVDNAQADEAAKPEEPAGETGEKEENADQLFTLKHLDDTRQVNREEVIALAQKGIDYDRKVGKLNNELAEYKGFFEELAANSGLSIEQFMDSVRAKLLVASEAKEGRAVSEAEAIFRVQKARSDKAKAAEETARKEAQDAEETRKRKSAEAIAAFTKAFPDVKATDIPQEVWDDTSRNGDLLGAYTRYANAQTAKENAELKKRIAALEQNAKNSSRSLGSKKTAGSAKAMDAFDEGWDSI